MHKVKLECLALAKSYAQNIDELFNYGDKIQNYIFDAQPNEVRRVYYVDVGDMSGEDAEAKLREIKKEVSKRQVLMETASPDAIAASEIPPAEPEEEIPEKTVDPMAQVYEHIIGTEEDLRREMEWHVRSANRIFAEKSSHVELAPLPLPHQVLPALDDEAVVAAMMAPVEPRPDVLKEFHYSNYRATDQLHGHFPLRPGLLRAAEAFGKENVVLNTCRQIGTTGLIAALARHYMVRKNTLNGQLNRVLVLTNSYSQVKTLSERIDDSSVTIMTFEMAATKFKPCEIGYSVVLIDMAAFIPYASEALIQAYIAASGIQDALGNIAHPRIFMASVPGQDAGWFFEAYTSTRDDAMFTKQLALSWRDTDMTPERAAKLAEEIGTRSFSHLYENQFRIDDAN